MLKKILLLLLFSFSALLQAEEKIAQAGPVEICYETFGQESDPAILLIMGGGCQGVYWPEPLCQGLAQAGYFVIRYDNRDTGLSTLIDFEKDPYTLLDMAKDGLALLDALNIEKAHLVGLSMGGPIAELMAASAPERVQTLTLVATSCDFRPLLLTVANQPVPQGLLSNPLPHYLAWLKQMQNPPEGDEKQAQLELSGWKLLSGDFFDEKLISSIVQTAKERERSSSTIANHLKAMELSFDLIREVPALVTVPTLVVHGSEDAIFPPDHGKALADSIKNSRHILISGMGHAPSLALLVLVVGNIEELPSR
jgi:pimeloyl-ACP methyl ester carboxylesterase